MPLVHFEFLLPSFALVLARMTGMMLAVPMFSSAQIPVRIKASLVVAMSLAIFPAVMHLLPQTLSPVEAVTGMAGELVVGEVLGFGAGLVFYGAQLAGHIVSHQSGLLLGEVVNPLLESQSGVIDQLWFFSVFMLFLVVGGHLAVVAALLHSFETVPPMRMIVDGVSADFAVDMLGGIFELALRLAGPAILALLLALAAMGVLSKTLPQFNILNVGFGVKTALAMLIMAFTLVHSKGLINRAMDGALDGVTGVMEHVGWRLTHGG